MPYDNDKIAELVAAAQDGMVKPQPFTVADAITPAAGFVINGITNPFVFGPVCIMGFSFGHAGAMALVDNTPVTLGTLAPALQPPGENDGNDDLWGGDDAEAFGWAGVYPNDETPGRFNIDSEGLIQFTPKAALSSVANIAFRCSQIIVPIRRSFSTDVA